MRGTRRTKWRWGPHAGVRAAVFVLLALAAHAMWPARGPVAPGPRASALAALPAATAAGDALDKSDTLTISLGSEVDTLDPQIGNNRISITVAYQLFDTLLDREPKTSQPVPRLATLVTSVTPTRWRLRLRPDATFTDGEPVDAAAVKFSLERFVDPNEKSALAGQFRWIKQIIIVDPHTVDLETEQPFPLVKEELTVAFIVPPKYVQSAGTAFAQRPVGSGPYKFASWERGQRLVMTRNEAYWGRKPAIKNLVFVPVTETATRLAGLLSGSVDVVRGIPPDQVGTIGQSSVARVISAPSIRLDFLVLDAFGRAGKTPAMNKDARLGIAHAIDTKAIVEQLLVGQAVRTCTVANPMQFGYDASIPCYAYDPQMSKQLLAQAGYPSGFEITLNTFSGNAVAVKEVGQAIQGYLSAVGIKANIKHYAEAGQFSKDLAAGKLVGIHLQSAGSYGLFDLQGLYEYGLTDKSTVSYVLEPQIQAWLKETEATVTASKRKQLLSRIQKRINDEVYWYPLWAQKLSIGVSNRVNAEVSSDDTLRLYFFSWKK
jgi:peptide/nickel transport system substrate-binding protein